MILLFDCLVFADWSLCCLVVVLIVGCAFVCFGLNWFGLFAACCCGGFGFVVLGFEF